MKINNTTGNQFICERNHEGAPQSDLYFIILLVILGFLVYQ